MLTRIFSFEAARSRLSFKTLFTLLYYIREIDHFTPFERNNSDRPCMCGFPSLSAFLLWCIVRYGYMEIWKYGAGRVCHVVCVDSRAFRTSLCFQPRQKKERSLFSFLSRLAVRFRLAGAKPKLNKSSAEFSFVISRSWCRWFRRERFRKIFTSHARNHFQSIFISPPWAFARTCKSKTIFVPFPFL